MFCTGPAENPKNQNLLTHEILPVGARYIVPLRLDFNSVGGFIRRLLLSLHQFDIETE